MNEDYDRKFIQLKLLDSSVILEEHSKNLRHVLYELSSEIKRSGNYLYIQIVFDELRTQLYRASSALTKTYDSAITYFFHCIFSNRPVYFPIISGDTSYRVSFIEVGLSWTILKRDYIKPYKNYLAFDIISVNSKQFKAVLTDTPSNSLPEEPNYISSLDLNRPDVNIPYTVPAEIFSFSAPISYLLQHMSNDPFKE